MHENSLLSERMTLLGAVDPLSAGAGTRSTAWFDAAEFFLMLGILMIGATDGAGATVYVDEATDNAGTGSTVLKTVAFVPAANTQQFINVRSKELDENVLGQSNRFIRFRIVQTGTSTVSLVVLGGDKRYGQPQLANAASLVAITQ